MSRPIPRKLLDAATTAGEGPHVLDTEGFTAVSLQLVYTAKRVSVALKGRLLGSPVESTLKTLDALTCKSGRVIKLDDWPGGIEEVWAEVIAIDGGEVSLYFCGRD